MAELHTQIDSLLKVVERRIEKTPVSSNTSRIEELPLEKKPSIKAKARTPPPERNQITNFTFKPTINKKSLFLASRKETPSKRIHKPKKPPNEPTSFSFTPTLNKKSELLSTSPVKGNRWKKLYELRVYRDEQLKFRQEQKAAEELESEKASCTFRPKTKEKKSKENVISRLYNWKTVNNMKIKKIELEEEGKDLTGCSFAPVIKEYSEKRRYKLFEKNGVEKFVRRQEKARRSSREKFEKVAKTERVREINEYEFEAAIRELHKELIDLDC